MPIVNCRICDRKFYTKPNWLLRGHGIYCSRTCKHKAQMIGKFVNCFICNKSVYKPPKQLKNSKSKKYFCNKSCQTIWRNSIVNVGANHPNWKGGEYTYRDVMKRNKIPQICNRCNNLDKRVLAVHHLDKNRKNNRLENLVWLCHNCHFIIHHHLEEKERFMLKIDR